MIKQIEIELGYKMPSDEEFVRWSDEAAAHKRPKIFQKFVISGIIF